MRKEIMDIVLKATDNASNTFEAVQDAAEDLERSLDNVGKEGTQDMERLEDGADQAEDDVRELGDEAKKTGDAVEDLGDKSESSGATLQMAFQNIADGVMRAKEGVVELGRNLMDTLELAGQQQQQETFLKMSIGAEDAAKQMKIINQLVADLPGDDVAIGGLLSQAAAKNAKITADELDRMGTNAADYFAAMTNYGKSSVEAQQDLTNYILAGNTAELERSPVLQAHIDKLKQATTVEERNKALQEALAEEGWAGISMQDTYNNKLETFTAMLDRGKRQMGGLFLDAASGAMDFLSNLDTATGGVLGMGIAIGTVAGGPMIDLVTGVGQMATGLKALQTAFEGTAIATAIAEQGFWATAAAELAALWPILLIVGALVALGVAVYEVGKYFGWWTDVGSMIDAIWAGVQRLWSAFINHPDVQGFIQGVSDAWNAMQPYIQAIIRWVKSFFKTSGKKDFDIVRTLINAISTAWRVMTTPIRNVISVVRALWNAIKTGSNAARSTVNSIGNAFRGLPGRIRGAVGGVTSAISQPFTNAYNKIIGIVDKIKAKASSIGNISIPSFFGGEDLSFYGGEDLTYTNDKLTVDMNQNINLSLDLRNVPSTMDERALAGMINETLDSREFITRLVNNPDFQSLDGKVKQRIVLKSNRANGRGV